MVGQSIGLTRNHYRFPTNLHQPCIYIYGPYAHTLHLSREVPIYGLSERLRMLSVAVFGSLRLAQFRPAVEHEHRECEIDSALIFRIGGIEDSGESRCTIKTAPKSYDKLP
jgi:hypothetical protein